jgi:hypothetical protein
MNVLVIDVGGTHIKVLATEQKAPLQFISGPKMTAKQMASGVVKLAAAWNYEVFLSDIRDQCYTAVSCTSRTTLAPAG